MTVTASSRAKPGASQSAERRWRSRLGKCADDVAGYGGALEDALEVRDRAVVEAIGQGWSKGKVSRWARISDTRVGQILDRAAAALR